MARCVLCERRVGDGCAECRAATLLEALKKIEGGHFPGISTMIKAGNWKGVATMFQQIARAAIATA